MPATATRRSFDSGTGALSSDSLRALTEALPALYAETSLSELPRAFADVLVKLVPGESHGIVIHDHGRGKRIWHLRPAAPV